MPWKALRVHRPLTMRCRWMPCRRSSCLSSGSRRPWVSFEGSTSAQAWASASVGRRSRRLRGRVRRSTHLLGSPAWRRHPWWSQSRSSIVRDPPGADAAWAPRSPWRRPKCSPNLLRSHRCRGRPHPRASAHRPTGVGRRRWSRRCRPRPGCPGSYGELPSLDARERDIRERGGQTWGVAPWGAATVSVQRARPQTACAAAHWVARVIAHPIRPSPALAFPRSRLSGGSGARRAAVRAPPRRCGSRSGAAWGAALGEQICGQHNSEVAWDPPRAG